MTVAPGCRRLLGRHRRSAAAAGTKAAWIIAWLALAATLRRAAALAWVPGDVLLETTRRHTNGKLYRSLLVWDAGSGAPRNDPIILYPYARAAPLALTRPMVSSDGRLLVSLGVPDGKTLSLVAVQAEGANPKVLAVEPLARYLGPGDPAPLLGAVDVHNTYDDNKVVIPDQYAVFMFGLDAGGRGTAVMRWQLRLNTGAEFPEVTYIESMTLAGFGADSGGSFHDYFHLQVFRPYQMVIHAMVYPIFSPNSQPRLEAFVLNWKTRQLDSYPVDLGDSQPVPTLVNSQWDIASVPGGFLTLLKSRGTNSSGAPTNVYTCTLVKATANSGRTASETFLPKGNSTGSVNDWSGLATDSAREGGPVWFWTLRRSVAANGTGQPQTRLVKISIEDGSSPAEFLVPPDPTDAAAMTAALGVVRTPANYTVKF